MVMNTASIAPRIYRSCGSGSWTLAATLNDASRAVYSLLVVDDRLYATTGVTAQQPGGVYGTADGLNWVKVSATSFVGQANALHSLVAWNGAFWLGTLNFQIGTAVWRSTDLSTWTKASADGFGLGPVEEEVYRLFPWDDLLLAGTLNKVDGGRIWVTEDGSTWTEVGEPGANAGSDYKGIYDFVLFNGKVYSAHRVGASIAIPSFPFAIVRLGLGSRAYPSRSQSQTDHDPVPLVDTRAVVSEVVIPLEIILRFADTSVGPMYLIGFPS